MRHHLHPPRPRALALIRDHPRLLGGHLPGPLRSATYRTQLSSELLSKRLGLLHDVLPAAATIGFLVDPTYPGSDSQARDLQEAARTLRLQVQAVRAAREAAVDTAV